MGNIYRTNPAAIREVLENIDTTGISLDAQELLRSLEELADRKDPCGLGKKDPMELCDLGCLFAYSLWDGYEEVEALLKSGQFQNFGDSLSQDELYDLVEEIVAKVPWNADCFVSRSPGEKVIANAIEEVLLEHIKAKPFSFTSPIYYEGNHYNHWYGELYASDFLIEKLRKKLSAESPKAELRQDPRPEFFVSYDLIHCTVIVHARFSFTENSKKLPSTTPVPLSSSESDLLISCIENACRKRHSGKDCLSVLNEQRAMEGRSPLKQALSGRIRFFQNIDETDSVLVNQALSQER